MDSLQFVIGIFIIGALIAFWAAVVIIVFAGGSVSALVALAWCIETFAVVVAWVRS